MGKVSHPKTLQYCAPTGIKIQTANLLVITRLTLPSTALWHVKRARITGFKAELGL